MQCAPVVPANQVRPHSTRVRPTVPLTPPAISSRALAAKISSSPNPSAPLPTTDSRAPRRRGPSIFGLITAPPHPTEGSGTGAPLLMQTAAAFRPCPARSLRGPSDPSRPLLSARPLCVSSSSSSSAAAVSTRCGAVGARGLGFGLLPVSPDRERSSSSRQRQVACGAAAGDAAKAKEEGGGLLQTLQLGLGFGLWYLFNIYFNIYNKQVLKVFPYPINITEIQFAVGSVVASLMWMTGILKRPKISGAQLLAILPLAMVHTMGNLFTNMSLGKVAVSFTHTIKAMEPFFSVLLSAIFLGEMPTVWVVLSLLPIVGGVGLASLTEASFNWAGFWSAMASNVTFQSRNVLSKKVMVKKEGEESLDNINLFSIITVMSFFLLAPVTFLTEGVKITPTFLQSAGLNVQQVLTRSLLAGLCFHAYQQVSYMILSKVSPVTHSVGNCVKRVVVIVTSVLVFKTPVSPVNSLGTGIALAGVFLYSQLKRLKPKPKSG